MRFDDNRSKWGRYVPAFVFLIFVYGMAVWFVFSPKLDYSSAEKRYLQEFPNASIENISSGQFGTEFESYFADHFPNRNLWVGFNAYYSLATGNNGSSGVYHCKNDYLINKPVSTDNKLDKNTKAIIDFKNSISTPVTVMFAPSTGYVCDDVLPIFHDKYNDDAYFEDISKKLSQENISFVDLRETFKNEYKNGNQLYYRTDHHWTSYGAYTAYVQLCNQLGLTPADKSKFDIEKYSGFYGTTYSTSGFMLTPPDDIEVWNNKQNTESDITVIITEGTESNTYNSMFFKSHLEEDDKYPVYVDGNHALTEITNKNAKGGTLVMVKDSFGHCIAPFLAENYSKILMIDMRYYKLDVSKLIEQENPEQVLVMYGIDNIATDTDLVWIN